MKPDIQHRDDIAALINAFYDTVKRNPVIGHFFTQVVAVDWEKHLPVMYDFWEGVVFGTHTYKSNPITPHQHLHRLHALQKTDFEEWLRIFHATVDEMYEGSNATLIKQRAASIATVMQLKVIHHNPFSV